MYLPNLVHDLPRVLFSITFIAMMAIGCFWVVQFFMLGCLWTSMLVIAAWPLLIKAQLLLWERRSLAVTVMTLLPFVLPVSIVLSSIVNNSASAVTWASNLNKVHLPTLAWLCRRMWRWRDASSMAPGNRCLPAVSPF
ncbi:hypothetical protein A359_09150 [secondary endosymbiont of Ctenarytaina eucalypti]|uniref:Inner membrane protein n=1 Tax=secondary endosymbiont of Ctenarytaina eucalypti TaxID=1199245 RepID=J3VTH7_9ENTR|nr:hypothetical protein A359_09150 [secondary endosymbiont of Ctenarytaina eucalypti]